MSGDSRRSVINMKVLPIIGLAILLAGCTTGNCPSEVATFRHKLFTASFPEAHTAGQNLLRLPIFKSESRTTRDEVMRLLGRPDRLTNDAVCYKTNGGPLWIEFNNGVLVNAALVSPPRWRGTNEELADWWEKTRNQDNWDQDDRT